MKRGSKLISLGLVLLISCAPTLPDPDRELLTELDPKVDNLVKAYNAQNYEEFSRDFDERMLEGLNEAEFEGDFRRSVFEVIGKHKSRKVQLVTRPDGRILVTYRAIFEEEPTVTLRVFFEPEGRRRITGLFFQSAKLQSSENAQRYVELASVHFFQERG